MKLKHLVAAFAALGFTAVGSAEATQSVDAQINYLQAKVTKMEEQMGKSAGATTSGKSMSGSVTFDRELSHDLLSFQSGAGTEMFLLHARHNGMAPNSLYLGGLLRGSVNYSNIVKTNVSGHNTGNPTYTSAVFAKTKQSATSSVTVPAAQLLFVGTINDFTTGVVELNADAGDSVIVNQAYMLLGNLDESMFFGTIGKKVPTFGNFSTYNTSFEPLTRTYFQPGSTNQASVGVTKDAMTFVVTVMNGGAPAGNLYTKTSTKLDNAAFDFKYDHEMYGTDWTFGAGYLKGFTAMTKTITQTSGSVAANNVTVGSIAAATGSNVSGAWDYNMSVAFDSFKLKAEYLAADKKINTKSMSAYSVGGMYEFQWMGKDGDVHLDYSAFSQNGGNANNDLATNSQFVLGMTHHCAENFQVGLEYAMSRYQIGLVSGDHFSSNDVALTLQANF